MPDATATAPAAGPTAAATAAPAPPPRHADDADPVTIIYTSGTSGEPKGVVLTAANVTYMLGCTNGRLDLLMGQRSEPEHMFQYLPFCFAASWILLLTALSRNSVLTLSTDLSKLSDELKLASPDYFLNVPTLLERVRARIEESVKERGGIATAIFPRAQQAYIRRHETQGAFGDSFWLALANSLIFPTIRKSIGPNLKALICGSAPLAVRNAAFFHDARHSRAAGLRPHGNHRDLHDGRSALGRTRARRPGDSGNGNDRSPRTAKSWCADRIFFPVTGSVPRKPRRRWKADGSTPAIRAKWTRAATGASPGA